MLYSWQGLSLDQRAAAEPFYFTQICRPVRIWRRLSASPFALYAVGTACHPGWGDRAREGWRELQTRARLQATVEGLPQGFCRVMALELQWYMQSRLLRDADWAGMAHSLEIRTPLVDWELFKALVPHLMLEGSRPGKKAFAATPVKPLPKTIADRPKSGFSVPVHQWLDAYSGERGLRGWARFIAGAFQL